MTAPVDLTPLDREWPDAEAVRADGEDFSTHGKKYLSIAADGQQTWTSGISTHFLSPADQVEDAKNAYRTILDSATTVASVAQEVRDALVSYADEVAALKTRREDARSAGEALNERIAAGEEGLEGERAAVQADVDGVAEDLEQAKETCGKELGKISADIPVHPTISSELANLGLTSAGYVASQLRFHDVEYVRTTKVTTVTTPTIANRLRNMQVAFERQPGRWIPSIAVDMPKQTRTSTTAAERYLKTRSTASLPKTATWQSKLVDDLRRSPATKVTVVSDETLRKRHGGFFSGDGVRTRTRTTVTEERPNRHMPKDAPETRTGAAGWANRGLKFGGGALSVFSAGVTYVDEGNQARQEVENEQRFAHLTAEEKESVAQRRQVVATATNTGIDLAAGGAGAAVGGMVGGPVGAGVGFAVGVGLSWMSDQDWFGGKSVKEHASDGANDVVDAAVR